MGGDRGRPCARLQVGHALAALTVSVGDSDPIAVSSIRSFSALLTKALVQFAFGWCVAWAAPELDQEFHPDFTTTRGTVLFAVCAQPDERLLVAGDFALAQGQSRPGLARILADGALDTSFDPGAGVDGLVYAIAVQPSDGKVIVGGRFRTCAGCPRYLLARLHPDGSLDSSFRPLLAGPEGSYVSAIALQPDGRVVVGGAFEATEGLSRRGVVRLLPTGGLDRSFDPGSGVAGGWVHDLALQDDGRLLVGGGFTEVDGLPASGLARLEPDGRPDRSFHCQLSLLGADGKVLAVDWHPTQGLVVVGAFDEVNGAPRGGLARLRPDGGLDDSFDPRGGIAPDSGTPYDVALLPDGSVVVTGDFWLAAGVERTGLARFDSTGAPTTADGGTDDLGGAGSAFGNMLATLPDGRLLVAGQFESVGDSPRHCLARLLPDGRLDSAFWGAESVFEFAGAVHCLVPLADGDVLVGGEFERVNGQTRHALARLDKRGGLEGSFDAGFAADAVVHAIAIGPDGRLLVGGLFEGIGGADCANLTRLLPDGTLDASFALVRSDAAVRALALLPDRRIVVAGEFRQFEDLRRFGMVRLGPDGEPDTAFEPRFEIGLDRAAVLALALPPDGELLAAGYFDSVNGEPRRGVVRLHADGELDPGFKVDLAGTDAPPIVNAMAPRADGRLVIGGVFDSVDRERRRGLARVYDDGRLDASFGSGDEPSGPGVSAGGVEAVLLLPDGQVAVGGGFERADLERVRSFALLSNIGSMPESDGGSGAPNGTVHALAWQGGNALLVGGSFVQVAGRRHASLARLLVAPAQLAHRLAMTSNEDEIRVHWDGGGRLFEAGEVQGPWHELRDAHSPYAAPSGLGTRFFRWTE